MIIGKKKFNGNKYRIEKRKVGKIVSRGNRTRQTANWLKRPGNMEKKRAHIKVYEALLEGWLKKPKKCSKCTSRKFIQAHHNDYSKPLEVIWVCPKCHYKIHRKEKLKMQKEKCKCGHTWIPRTEKPKTCPKCKNYLERKIDVKNK